MRASGDGEKEALQNKNRVYHIELQNGHRHNMNNDIINCKETIKI